MVVEKSTPNDPFSINSYQLVHSEPSDLLTQRASKSSWFFSKQNQNSTIWFSKGDHFLTLSPFPSKPITFDPYCRESISSLGAVTISMISYPRFLSWRRLRWFDSALQQGGAKKVMPQSHIAGGFITGNKSRPRVSGLIFRQAIEINKSKNTQAGVIYLRWRTAPEK